MSRPTHGSRPTLVPAAHTSAGRRAPRSGRTVPGGVQHHVLDEALFRGALLREGRRADRFEESFVLVRISLAGGTAVEARWSRILDTLNLTARDTDIVGWFEHGLSIGLIRPHVDGDAHETAAGLGMTAQHELVRSLEPDEAVNCSIQVDVFSPHAETARRLPGATTDAAPGPSALLRLGAKRLIDITGSAALLLGSRGRRNACSLR